MSFKFAAIELKSGETEHQGIRFFFRTAESFGLKFKFLEPYGPFTLGSLRLLRFKTDCGDLETLVVPFQEENRSLVLPGKGGYVLHTQVTKGTVAISTMQAERLPGYKRRYRGTSDKFWLRQFT